MFGSFVTLMSAAAMLQQTPTPPKSYVLIVSGVGGEPEYVESFYESGKRLANAMHFKQGVPTSAIYFLAENPARDTSHNDSVHVRGVSNKAEIEKAFASITAAVAPNDLVMVVLIGHGDNQDGVSRFNIKGPDLSAEDFGKLLKPLSKQRVAFVNGASSSSEFIEALSAPNRVIITANRNEKERNDVKFAKYFAATYDDSTSDLNKDGRTSVLEAYMVTRFKVFSDYKGASLIMTENARINDTGDSVGVANPDTVIVADSANLDSAAMKAAADSIAKMTPAMKAAADSAAKKAAANAPASAPNPAGKFAATLFLAPEKPKPIEKPKPEPSVPPTPPSTPPSPEKQK